MVLEIAGAVASAAFVALVVAVIMTLVKLRRTAMVVQRDISRLTSEMSNLAHSANGLTLDVKHKVDAFNGVFHAFQRHNKEDSNQTVDKVAEIVRWCISGIVLLKKNKE